MQKDVTKAPEFLQLSAGQYVGVEAAIHAIQDICWCWNGCSSLDWCWECIRLHKSQGNVT